jgi:hypothetical protein
MFFLLKISKFGGNYAYCLPHYLRIRHLAHTLYLCFVWFLQQELIITVNKVTRLMFVTMMSIVGGEDNNVLCITLINTVFKGKKIGLHFLNIYNC